MRAVTSSSNIFRRKLCPGSERMEARAIESQQDNPAADDGTLLHPFACNPKLKRFHLTEEQQRRLRRADDGTKQLLAAAAAKFNANPLEDPPAWIEETLMLRGPDGEEIFPGKSDVAYGYPGAVAVQDFKMGYTPVPKAEVNYQVASYGVMWSDHLQVSEVIVGINQPRMTPPLSLAHYTRNGIEKARRELAAIKHAAEDPGAPLIAGEHQCQYCKAKLFCDAYAQRFQPLAVRPDSYAIEMMPADALHKFGIACKAADRIKGQVFAEIRRRIEADEMPGWELVENGETRELVDMVAAHRELATYFERIGGYSGARFTECTVMVWGRLTKLMQELTGFSEARSKALINELLNPFIVRRKKEPTPQPK